MEPDWAYLPALALDLIFDKLGGEPLDRVWFGAVCKNWCSVKDQFRGKVLPRLMIPTKRKSRKERNLYDIVAERVYNFKLPVPYSKKCCGSSHGWLATVDPNYVVTLMNPFKNLKIGLPRLNRGLSNRCYYELNMRKVTLSADPISNPNDYVVAAVHSERCCLAFIRKGQKFWTYIHEDFFCFTDITFYKGRVYAAGRWNNIVSLDLCYSDDPYGIEKIMPNVLYKGGRNEPYADRAYLVKSLEGDLWMVRRFLGSRFFDEDNTEDSDVYSTGTERFEVYKLELDFQSGKLLQMLKLESLGDNILFVGDNDSISVSASYFSDCLHRDSIYYTDDFNEEDPSPYLSGPFDNGIYNVKDGSFAKHYPYNPSFKRMPPPLWILPPFEWD
ncbi:putative F-box protein At4g22660 [Gastrolobium bilobum]|uniref:putative F-box protein At4g22660 n=1 Tax=Gastrolobium bilobum TaxID=150636 RepID=UPI002AB179BE|nr:putative F-box protein At4g22660 [Gastrolobium bilobum]